MHDVNIDELTNIGDDLNEPGDFIENVDPEVLFEERHEGPSEHEGVAEEADLEHEVEIGKLKFTPIKLASQSSGLSFFVPFP